MYNYYDDYSSYPNFFDTNRQQNDTKNSLVSLNEGFLRGSMFADLYEPYIKPIPPKNPSSEKEQWMRRIQELAFATNDLALYLDLNPEDMNVLNIFNQYNTQLEEVTKNYENKYGPLCFNSTSDSETNWLWINNPWPWEKEANN